MSIYLHVLEMKKLLGNIEGWLDKAAAHATAKKFDVNTLLQTRLAPDMLPLVFQIRVACDHAKGAAARSAGKEVPSHPDTEQTVDDLKKRLATVIEFLGTFKEADFHGATDRRVTMPRWEGKTMSASEYFIEYAQPNFYFHIAMTYALLRHNGVELGKRDFVGHLPMH
jgi:uncharacterized protein